MGNIGNPLQKYGSGAYGAAPIENLPLGYYLGLLTSEYRNSPKLNAFLALLLQKFQDASQCLVQMEAAFDIDNAIGVQLDAIGTIVGASRTLPFQPTGGLSPVLGDADYRTYLKSKAAQNQWNGTIDGLQNIWQTLFPGGQIIVADHQNMSATIFLTGTFSPILQQMILNGLVVPRPQAVQYNYVFNLPAFGFDLNNAFIAGFDVGKWS
jgi:hypothetical protein